ncbi:acyltransferase family protein [Streptomyces sp. SID13666]|uniref:acyltransferase family protein n=1 Tax=unclassified Streptomyces TaxID=2593676 RepID=UPI0013BFB17F|nr:MULTISPECIES: acyltransferase family protein [unclassified Streptomyces]NEA52709.1 acyltransferase family protein [Streptomyces sp. SID13666]NEA69964.1 acyltransferase family protein [Streptomyces sp. SID13588]
MPSTTVPDRHPETADRAGRPTPGAGSTGNRFRKAGPTGSRPPAPGFRPDIEGLRAAAVLAVLAFHAELPGLTGGFVGVDIFFVISGYLITGLLIREAATTGRIRLGEFFSRRARRLLPSAAVVLGATALAAAWLTVPLRRTDLEYDVLAAALSTANWRFVSQQTDYLAAGRDPSPLLHFWSLAVEEQFYLFWGPLLALIVFAVLRTSRRGRAVRSAVFAVTALLTLGSFLLALHWTHTSVSLAYLGTPSRAWQFGVGALLALTPWHRLRGLSAIRPVCGWAGAAAIVWCVVRYDGGTPYPGYAALVPTLATAAVILAGTGDADATDGATAYGVGRILRGRIPRAIGRLSYTLYLWHWPVLVLAEARLGTLGWPARAALTVASALPAFATMRWIEQPLRRSRTVSEFPRRGLALGVAAVVLPVVLALVVGTGTMNLLASAPEFDLKGLPPGAADGRSLLLRTGTPLKDGPPVPGAVQARKDFPPDGACEVAPTATTSPPCLFGATASPDRIVLLGDSHAGQWFSPLLGIAAQRGWALQELVKQGCPLPQLTVRNPQLGRTYTECDTWRADSLSRLRQGPKPRLVVVASLNRYTDDQQLLTAGWEKTLSPLRALGVPIVYIQDTPIPGTDIPACVSGHTKDPDACAFDRATAQWPDPLAASIAAGRLPGVRAVEMNSVLCPGAGATCPAVLERILLYRDDAHLTNVAATVLAPRLERLLTDAGALPDRDAVPSGRWTQLLRDDFDGPAGSRPSAAKWQYDLGTCYPGCPAAQWGTGEIETMTDSTDNVRLDGKGSLEIVPRLRNGRWSSGRIESKRSDYAPPPGGVLRIEASIALPDVTGPAAAGYWPAFWTLGSGLRNGYTGWPAIGELDVMENVNGRDSVFGTMHCGTLEGGPCKEPQGLGSGDRSCPDCRTGFHSYAVEVDLTAGAEQVRWYLDGREYHKVTAAQMDPRTWDDAVHHGLFLILNVAVGGNLPAALGAPAGPTTEPGHPMRVQYVAVSARGAARS